jgi:hypothetical protein
MLTVDLSFIFFASHFETWFSEEKALNSSEVGVMHQAHLSIQGLRDFHSTMYERVSDRRWLAMRLSCLCTAWPSRQLHGARACSNEESTARRKDDQGMHLNLLI